MQKAVLGYSPRADTGRAGRGLAVRIGLTGGVASGKSAVTAMLRELGAVVIDADQLARELVAAGTPGLAAVVEEFGHGVLTAEGELDRPALSSTIFADASARRRLEEVIHPLVFAEIQRLEEEAPEGSVVVHDIPLLVESGRAGTFDTVIVVDTPPQTQLERMVRDRGWSREEAEARMRAQCSREERLAIATHVIDNSGTLADLRRQVEEVYAELAPPAESG